MDWSYNVAYMRGPDGEDERMFVQLFSPLQTQKHEVTRIPLAVALPEDAPRSGTLDEAPREVLLAIIRSVFVPL